jgi:uncharacterized protein (DUF433 family)
VAKSVRSPYVEVRNGAYYVAGTRVSLASVIHAFRQGASRETILQDFPYLNSLAKVYGAITFIVENPTVVEECLEGQAQRWKDLEQRHPLPPEMVERFKRAREELKKTLA